MHDDAKKDLAKPMSIISITELFAERCHSGQNDGYKENVFAPCYA
jgi:hypothetical protein